MVQLLAENSFQDKVIYSPNTIDVAWFSGDIFVKNQSHFLSLILFKFNTILSYKEKVFYKLIFISTFNAKISRTSCSEEQTNQNEDTYMCRLYTFAQGICL